MRTLPIAGGTLRFAAGEPWLMAIATPGPAGFDRAAAAVGAGARLVGVHSDSGPGCVELIARLVGTPGVPVAVLTGDPERARAGIEAGAALVVPRGGPPSPELEAVCARRGAGLMMAGGAEQRADRPLLVCAASPEPPRELAALARAIELEANVIAVRDVAAAADFLAVQAVLCGRRDLDPGLRLPAALRREPEPPLGYPSN